MSCFKQKKNKLYPEINQQQENQSLTKQQMQTQETAFASNFKQQYQVATTNSSQFEQQNEQIQLHQTQKSSQNEKHKVTQISDEDEDINEFEDKEKSINQNQNNQQYKQNGNQIEKNQKLFDQFSQNQEEFNENANGNLMISNVSTQKNPMLGSENIERNLSLDLQNQQQQPYSAQKNTFNKSTKLVDKDFIKSQELKLVKELKKNIVGYNAKIQTPVGVMCGVYIDHTATNRPFSLIEKHIQSDIKPLIANSHTETSETGHFSTQLLHKAEEIILNCFNVNIETHFAIPCGSGATGAFERMSKIINFEKIALETIWTKKYMLNSIQNNTEDSKWKEDPDVPVVFITMYEHHSNILVWMQIGCKLVPIALDKEGDLNLDDFQKQLQLHQHYKHQLVSFSACSNVTSQHTNLSAVDKIIKIHRTKLKPEQNFFYAIDGAAYLSHARLNLSREEKNVDFVCMSPHKNLGGSEATGVLIVKKSAYKNAAPSFPGGGTVIFVRGFDLSKVFFDSDPTSREMPGTPNTIGFYRAALTFSLQDWITMKLIQTREKQNALYFYNKIQEINKEADQMDNGQTGQQQSSNQLKNSQKINRKIVIYGEQNMEKRFGVFSFNIYAPGDQMLDPLENSLLHPHFVAKLLNDFFGIQVRSGCSCAGPFGVILLNINEEFQKSLEHDVVVEHDSTRKPGWVRLDTNFVLEQYELDYILEALKMILFNGEHFIQFYHQTDTTGQFKMSDTKFSSEYQFGINGIYKTKEQIEQTLEFPMENRQQLLDKQLSNASKIFEDPYTYFYTQKMKKLGKQIHFISETQQILKEN